MDDKESSLGRIHDERRRGAIGPRPSMLSRPPAIGASHTPCRFGWPSGVRGGVNVLAFADAHRHETPRGDEGQPATRRGGLGGGGCCALTASEHNAAAAASAVASLSCDVQ